MPDISTTAEAVATGQSKGPKSLHEYAQLSDVGDFLLSSGTLDLDINALDEKGRTPLHLAAQAGEKRNYVNLVLCGADIDTQDNAERIPDSYCPESEDGKWIRDFTTMIREKMATGISQGEAVKAIKDPISGGFDKPVKKWKRLQTLGPYPDHPPENQRSLSIETVYSNAEIIDSATKDDDESDPDIFDSSEQTEQEV